MIWPIIRAIWFLLAGASSIVILALSINLQVTRTSITSLGLQPEYFNTTSTGSYDPASGTITVIGLYVAPIVTGAGIALGVVTTLIMLPLFLFSFGMKRLTCATMVFVELLWSFFLVVLWMAFAVVATMGTVYGIVETCHGDGICIQVQVLKGMTLAVWLLITAYFLTLLTLTSIGLSRGQRRAFISSTLTSDFFARKPQRNSTTSAVPISPRAHVSRTCSETDNESVYSVPTPIIKPIPVHLNMTSSMSHDAHMVHTDWHEMKPVAVDSPRSRMHEKQFSLESDDGEVSDVALDDDDISKHHGESIKVKPLV